MTNTKQLSIGTMSRLEADGSNINTIAEFGLECCQAVSWNMNLCTAKIAKIQKQRAADLGVRFAAMWAGLPGPAIWDFQRGPITLGLVPDTYRWVRIEALQQWADFAVEMGAPAVVTHCGFLPENMTDGTFEIIAQAIHDVAAYCKKLGLGFWFETGQETPVTLLRYIETIGLDNLGINLDPANLLMYGKGNPIDALDVFGQYVKCVHAKDGKVPVTGTHLGPEVKVGTGMVRYPEFIKKLLEVGFDGDLIIEREISGEQQRKEISETITYLKSLM